MMFNYFHGLIVPPVLDGDNYYGLLDAGRKYCALDMPAVEAGCSTKRGGCRFKCDQCICSSEHREDLERLMEYWRGKRSMGMPKIQANMILYTSSGWRMAVCDQEDNGFVPTYRLQIDGDKISLKDSAWINVKLHPEAIISIYGAAPDDDKGYDPMSLEEIRQLAAGGGDDHLIWTLPVEEMTLVQICKALGKRIKIVDKDK